MSAGPHRDKLVDHLDEHGALVTARKCACGYLWAPPEYARCNQCKGCPACCAWIAQKYARPK